MTTMCRRPFRYAAIALAALCALAPGGVVAKGDIVSVGGAITEILFALDQEHRILAVDSTSAHPPATQSLPNVGYLRQLAAEPILALEPGLVIALSDAGPPSSLEMIRRAGVPVIVVPQQPLPEGVQRKIELVSDAVGVPDRGRALAERIGAEMARLSEAIARREDTPSVLFLLSVGGGAPLVAGRETTAASIIALAGGRNAIDGFEGYRPLNPEAAVAAAPEVVLVTTATLEALGGAEAILSRPYLAHAPAAATGRLIAMDGLLLLGFGPRIGAATRALASAIHPRLALPPAD